MNQDFTTILILSLITNVIILIVGIVLDANDQKESNIGYAFSVCLALFSLGLFIISYDMFGFPFPTSLHGYESFLTILCLINPFNGVFVLAKFAKNDFKSPPKPSLSWLAKTPERRKIMIPGFRRVRIISISAPNTRIDVFNENTHPELCCRWKTDDIFQIAYIASEGAMPEGIVILTLIVKKGTDIQIVVRKLLTIEEDSYPEVFRNFKPEIRCPQIEWTPNGPNNIRGTIPGWSWAIAEIERKLENGTEFQYYVRIFGTEARYTTAGFAERYAQEKMEELFKVFYPSN